MRARLKVEFRTACPHFEFLGSVRINWEYSRRLLEDDKIAVAEKIAFGLDK